MEKPYLDHAALRRENPEYCRGCEVKASVVAFVWDHLKKSMPLSIPSRSQPAILPRHYEET